MILQTGFSDQIKTITELAGTIDGRLAVECRSVPALTACFRKYLASLKQRPIDTHALLPKISCNQKRNRALAAQFSNDSLLDDKSQTTVIECRADHAGAEKAMNIKQALNVLESLSGEHHALIRAIVTDIFVLPSCTARAGSTSQAVGIIWANPKLTYSSQDIVEMLVHELTHQAMFIDEIRYGHFAYQQIMNRETWAASAILNLMRPLDKVLHSIVVSAEIIRFRKRYLLGSEVSRVHPPTAVMISQLRQAIESTERSVNAHGEILSERALFLLESAKI